MKSTDKSNSQNKISRRTFLSQSAAGAAFIAAGPVAGFFSNSPQKKEKWPSGANSYRFHMIGQAHIDPVWLWPWSEGISVVHSTFRSALDRMNETPDFAFTASSAQFYQWIADNDPSMLEEIKKRVDEGRWNIVGGWWVEPDLNIPCGESLVRQGLYGQHTFQQLLGHRAKTAFNPDSFGHAGTLPQIFRKQGMENYIFMRPAKHEKNLPSDLFTWESPDGTQIMVYRIQISYNDEGPVKERVKAIMDQAGSNPPFRSFMAYYGAGDHGGGATKENIASINELKNDKTGPVVLFSTPDNYFREMRETKGLTLPVVKDDLQHHAPGCYTAGYEIKQNNRIAESALITAEKIASVGSVAWGAAYPSDELTSAWKRVLFLQFHDSMAGTSLPEHFLTAREGFGFATDIARQVESIALQKLEWQIPAEDPNSQYLLVFNPHSWEFNGNAEYDLGWETPRSSVITDDKGNTLQHQWNPGTAEAGDRKRLIVNLSVPSLGYRQIRIMQGEPAAVKYPAVAHDNMVENEFLKITVTPSGALNIYDKKNGRNLFSGDNTGYKAVIINDPSDTWSHDVKSFNEEIGAFGNAVIKTTENGPLRATIRVKTTYNASTLTTDWSLTAGSPYIEANVMLDWHEKLKMLKFSFPVNIDAPVATYEVPYGHIIRGINGDEDPGQRWIDLTGTGNGMTYGLAVINDSKYGYSVNGNDMRVSVARSAVFAHHRPRKLDMNEEHIWMDQGIQSFRMMLVPHSGTWQENNIPRISEELKVPVKVVYQGIHRGGMLTSDSFISVEPENVMITAVKHSEDGKGIVVRCVETSGVKVNGKIDFRFVRKKWNGSFNPCEIKSIFINPANGEIREVNMLEE